MNEPSYSPHILLKTPDIMTLAAITRLLSAELQALDETILRCLESQVDVVNKIGHYLVGNGGKRIRPLVLLLSARACHAKGDEPISMAAIIEFIHTATLLHDDVIDGSNLRRGRPTANRVWDNPTAILVGDFLYSRAFQMMVSLNSMASMRILADATNVIAEGEVLQLAHRNKPDIEEASYLSVIECKTAKLFEAAAQLGAVMAKQCTPIEQALANYGLHIGMAFQLADDVLDYQATAEEWGKNIGDDLAEGKATLPLIYALKNAEPSQRTQIRQAIEEGKLEDLEIIQKVIVSTGGIDYALQAAQRHIDIAKEAITQLPHSEYHEAMMSLATFAVARCV